MGGLTMGASGRLGGMWLPRGSDLCLRGARFAADVAGTQGCSAWALVGLIGSATALFFPRRAP